MHLNSVINTSSLMWDRCDACRAVALAVDTALRLADQRVLASGQAGVLDQSDAWKDYKEISVAIDCLKL
jgi:hypothetical protein